MNYLLYLAVLWALFAVIAVATWVMSETTAAICLSGSGWFGAGAYLSAVLAVRVGLPIPAAILLSTLGTFSVAYCVGLLLCRSHGEEFALASFGVAFILFDLFNNALSVTRGGYGFFGIPTLPGGITFALPTALALLGVVLVALNLLRRQPAWALLTAMGDDIGLAELLGKRVLGAKALLYAIVASICAIAGAIYSHTAGFLDPAFFRPVLAVYFIAMVAIGARGALAPVFGAAVFVAVPEIIDACIGVGGRLGYVRQLFFGMALVFGTLLSSRLLPANRSDP